MRVLVVVVALIALLALIALACRRGERTTPTPPRSTASPTVLGTPTPVPVNFPPPTTSAPRTALLDALAKMAPTFRTSGFWFGDAGRAMRAVGLEKPLSAEEVRALDASGRVRFQSVWSLPMSDTVLAGMSRAPGFVDTYGLTGEQAALVARTGRSSNDPFSTVYAEGAYQAGEIVGKLRMLGHQPEAAARRTYYTARADRASDASTDAGRLALNRLNRVYIDEHTFIRSPETASMIGVLQAWAGESPSLASDPAFARTAEALGDPLAAALFTREVALDTSLLSSPRALRKDAAWGTLHEWDVVGFGQGMDGSDRWWAVSLHHAEPLEGTLQASGKEAIAAALDANVRELTSRLAGYAVQGEGSALLLPAKPFAEWCASFSAGATAGEGGATATVRCSLKPEAPVGMWVLLVDLRELSFLLP